MPRPIKYERNQQVLDLPKNEEVVPDLEKVVLDSIGVPDDLVAVEVKDLWKGRYRVNVYRCIKNQKMISDSFFIYSFKDGIVSNPVMELKYFDKILREIPVQSSDNGLQST